MILANIKAELETATQPVGKMLRKGDDFHVLAIGFKNGMILQEHKSALPARLVVLEGEVVYHSAKGASALSRYEEHEIPVNELHWVEARQDSLILVIKGQ